MRDSLDVHDGNVEVAPLIPDPPLKRKRRYNGNDNIFHRCWNVFSYCSRWTCIFATLAAIVLIIILCRTLLPFGWPSWIPAIKYDVSDPHIVLIVSDDLGWNDVGYAKMISNNYDDNSENDNDIFNDLSTLLELEQRNRISKKTGKNSKNSKIEKVRNEDYNKMFEDRKISLSEFEEYYQDGEIFETPNIDVLASNGIILNRFYVSQEGASTRASILTGKNGYQLGLQNGVHTGSRAHIPAQTKLVSEYLSEKGYATHLVGKWNLGYAKWQFTPIERGFDTFVGFLQQFIDYWHYTASDDSTPYENRVGWDLWNGKNVYDLDTKERVLSTELFTAQIEQIISDHANSDTSDRPMFLMYGAPNPRTPLDYHSKFSQYCSQMSETLRQKYCNVVESFDVSVGTIVRSLIDNNMYDRTLIIIVSDNGGMICYDIGDSNKCSGASNFPLRAGKSTLFEGGVRTRALISGGKVPSSRSGGIYQSMFMHVDLFSTILGAANIQNEDSDVTGINHFDFLVSTSDSDDNNENDNNNDASGSMDSNFEERTNGILDLLMDDDGNLIRGAYIDYPYKYVIEVDQAYDGWYTTPLTNGGEIPFQAKATEGVYTSAHPGTVSMVDDYESYFESVTSSKSSSSSSSSSSNSIQSEGGGSSSSGKTNSLQFGTVELSDNGDTTMTYLEYLFNIEEDEMEHVNLAQNMQAKVDEYRQILEDEMNSDNYRTPQDCTTQEVASPWYFDNVWYPFYETKSD